MLATGKSPTRAILEDGFLLWKERFKSSPASAGIPEDLLDATISRASLEPQVIKRLNNQSEFTSSIWNYLDSAVSPKRIAAGKDALAAHREDLKKIERLFRRRRIHSCCNLGNRVRFRRLLGRHALWSTRWRLLRSIRTGRLFFEAELADALGILANNSEFEADWLGSWAGAFGHTQFMPSSFLRFAVSLDGGRGKYLRQEPGRRHRFYRELSKGLRLAARPALGRGDYVCRRASTTFLQTGESKNPPKPGIDWEFAEPIIRLCLTLEIRRLCCRPAARVRDSQLFPIFG